MGNRLSKITTRTGDDGTTGLGNNTRVSKNSIRIQAIGDVDELNSHIGLLLCEKLPIEIQEFLVEIQHQLFNLGGELAMPGYVLMKDDALLSLDNEIYKLNENLPSLKEFILPAGNKAACQTHICRTVARRAERSVVGIETTESMNHVPKHYLNRLSDYFFVLSRHLNLNCGQGEIYWKSERLKKSNLSTDESFHEN